MLLCEKLINTFRARTTPVQDTVQRRTFTETFSMPPSDAYISTTYSANKGTYLEQLPDEAIDLVVEQFANGRTL